MLAQEVNSVCDVLFQDHFAVVVGELRVGGFARVCE